jgi:membrane fusion protein (multidrug efflux system)
MLFNVWGSSWFYDNNRTRARMTDKDLPTASEDPQPGPPPASEAPPIAVHAGNGQETKAPPPPVLRRRAGVPLHKNKGIRVLVAGMAVLFLGVGVKKVWDRFHDVPKTEGSRGVVPTVTVHEVKAEHFQDVMQVVGTLAGGSEVALRFETDGRLQRYDFRPGDKVKKGDAICRLDGREQFLKLKKAETELHQMEKLYALGGITRGKLEEFQVTADIARNEYNKTLIRAPFDGILGGRDAEVGEFIGPNKKVGTLSSLETVMVNIGVIEKDLDKITLGQKVDLTVDTYAGTEFSGKIESIDPIVDDVTRTAKAQARLDNEGGLLLPGMYARARITLHEEDNALSVPRDAVEKTAAGSKVLVVDKESKAEARDVEAGYESSQFVLITRGLSPGDRVISPRPSEVKPGMKVRVAEGAKNP